MPGTKAGHDELTALGSQKGPPSLPMAGLFFFFGLREVRRPY
jgi:hypothetical protein